MPKLALMPAQFQFVNDQRRYAAYVGGIGSGKTFAGAVKALPRMQTPGFGMIAAPTYPQLRDSTLRSTIELLEEFGIRYDLNKGEMVLRILDSGHEVICRSLDNPESRRGPNLQWAWIDEAALISGDAWRIVKGRVRDGDNPQVWLTTTPKGRNWIWSEFVAEIDDYHAIYRTRTRDNKHLPADFADQLGYSGMFAAQELDGEFVAFEGLIYPMFQRSEHVQRIDCDGWATVLGIDIGARNPTAILTIRRSGDGRTHIEHEVYRPGMSSDEITDAIEAAIERTRCERAWIDPSARAYISTLNSRGHRQVKGANNDVLRGIGVVTSAIADGLTVDPACVQTIAEFESYRWADKTERDLPVKEHDHAMDALRYALVGDERKPIRATGAVAMPHVSSWGPGDFSPYGGPTW